MIATTGHSECTCNQTTTGICERHDPYERISRSYLFNGTASTDTWGDSNHSNYAQDYHRIYNRKAARAVKSRIRQDKYNRGMEYRNRLGRNRSRSKYAMNCLFYFDVMHKQAERIPLYLYKKPVALNRIEHSGSSNDRRINKRKAFLRKVRG